MAAVTLALGLFEASPASGQTLTPITAKNVKRSKKAANSGKPWAINYQDCVDNVRFTFSIAFSGVMTDLNFAVFVGSAGSGYDCSQPSGRTTAGSDCRTMYNQAAEGNRQIVLTAQEIVSDAGVDGCEEDISDRKVNLYFALVNSDGNPPGGATANSSCSGWCSKWDEIEIDLRGPAQPSSVSAGVGENMLLVSWDTATNKDINGYRLFCFSATEGATRSTASFRPLADDDDDLVDQGDAGPTGGQSQGGSTSTADTQAGAAGTAQTGTGGDGTVDQGTAGSGTATVAPCASGPLVPGERPDEEYRCGSVEGATASRADAKGLTNGTEYAVGVAAVDTVGNVGDLSQIACGSPHALDDFFEVYRREGGNGGGGYCAAAGRNRSGTFALAMGALLAAGALRQRRGRNS